MMYRIVNRDELPDDGSTMDFEGLAHGADVSFIWVNMPPGDRVRLHKHAYQEIFIIQEGSATYTVGSDTVEAHAGQIIVVDADVPHAFTNSGSIPLKQIDIHVSRHILTEWLE